jgi:small conductance mechanosensitive channel
MRGLWIFLLVFPTISLAQTPPAPPVAPPPTPVDTSEAARILRAKESIERTQKSIVELEAQINDPKSEYKIVKKEVEDLEERIQKSRKQLDELLAKDMNMAADELQLKIAELEKSLEESRTRLKLTTDRRNASQETLSTLKVRLVQEQKELDRLEGKTVPPPVPPKVEPKDPPQTEPKPTTPPLIPGVPTLPEIPAKDKGTGKTTQDPELEKARKRLEAALAASKDAEQQAASAGERVKAVQESIAAANKLLEAERLFAEESQKALNGLNEQMRAQPPEDPAEKKALSTKITQAQQRLTQARKRIKELEDKLDFLNDEYHTLEVERLAAISASERTKADADAAEREFANIRNPFTTRNMTRWITQHGPSLIGIALISLTLYLIVRTFSQQIVTIVLRAATRGREDDRENRASTLVGVFRYVSALFIIGGGTVMFLDEAGIPIVPLMGGAAVFGLAIAFGTQNLIKDYFTGFMMLMEDQYGVNDVVKIGSTSGLVEQITLRMTVLRDLEGTRHFIPHGSITQVSNLTHTWSRAMFDIPVAYKENVDKCISTLLNLARDMRNDPEYAQYIIEEPEMLGVDAFDSSSVVIKFLLKTKPLKQWLVKREMLRRIKNRFDELGIEIPYPHRTVFIRYPDGIPGMAMEHDQDHELVSAYRR